MKIGPDISPFRTAGILAFLEVGLNQRADLVANPGCCEIVPLDIVDPTSVHGPFDKGSCVPVCSIHQSRMGNFRRAYAAPDHVGKRITLDPA